MKDRITYIIPDGHQPVDPATIELDSRDASLPGFKAAKEWRVSLSTDDLPSELRVLLRESHELHLRWASVNHHETTPPLSARLPPGLHVFYTPLHGEPPSPRLCPELQRIFGYGVKCHGVAESFSRLEALGSRNTRSSAYQHYSQNAELDRLVDYIASAYCAGVAQCLREARLLEQATLLTFDFDTISQSVSVSGLWSPSARTGKIGKRRAQDTLELGILNREASDDFEEIAMGGFLAVVGEDERPKPTLFSFPSRHRQVPASGPEAVAFNASFRHPTGLHPTLQLTFSNSDFESPLPSCALHAYLTLPSQLFIDRYQFSDDLFLQSQNLVALHSLTGETDLEAPDWVVKQWGSAALFELLAPEGVAASQRSPGTWSVRIPMHLRYLPPKGTDGIGSTSQSSDAMRTASIPYPIVFWACPADSGLKMSNNPFDRVDLGYDGIFGPKTAFWHVPPAKMTGKLEATLVVPVLDLKKSGLVESGTGLVVVLGFLWVCWKLFVGLTRETETVTAAKKKK